MTSESTTHTRSVVDEMFDKLRGRIFCAIEAVLPDIEKEYFGGTKSITMLDNPDDFMPCFEINIGNLAETKPTDRRYAVGVDPYDLSSPCSTDGFAEIHLSPNEPIKPE